MKKEVLKKLQLGLISFSAFALLAACGNDGIDNDVPMDDDPTIEEPATDDSEEGDPAGSGAGEAEEEDN